MIVKKSAGKVVGAQLTRAEEQAMNMEIQRQIAEYDRKHANELISMILWNLHKEFGFGKERLKRYFMQFDDSINGLIKRLEMDDSDNVWLCTYFLKEYGVDLEEWEKELQKTDGKREAAKSSVLFEYR